MKKRLALLLTLCSFPVGLPLEAALVNGGFETGDPNGWSPSDFWTESDGATVERWGIRVTSENSRSGSYSRMLNLDAKGGTTYLYSYQEIDLVENQTDLRFSLYVDLNPTGTDRPGSFAGVDLRESGNGNVLANLVTFGGTMAGQHYGTAGWQDFGFDLSPYQPLGTVTLCFWIQAVNNQVEANQRIFLDDVALAESQPGGEILPDQHPNQLGRPAPDQGLALRGGRTGGATQDPSGPVSNPDPAISEAGGNSDFIADTLAARGTTTLDTGSGITSPGDHAYVIAAWNSIERDKAAADAVCDGIDDQTEIAAALSAGNRDTLS